MYFSGCDMIFTKKCVLRDHQMAHKKEKPFKCEICEKQFTQRGNLKTHQKSHSIQEGFNVLMKVVVKLLYQIVI